MVYRQGERKKSMERSKPPLHNFPMDLKWGNRKVLKCMNVNNSNGEVVPAPSGDRLLAVDRRLSGKRVGPEFEIGGSRDRRPSLPSPVRSGYNGIEALRKELMSDLHSKMKYFLREGLEKEEIRPSPPVKSTTQPPPAKVDGGAARPWNLRTRRAACKTPMINGVNGDGGGNVDAPRKTNNLSPLKNESRSPDSGDGTGAATSGLKRERAKFSYTLLRSEIEQDFLAMTGQRLPRRPKKRPRAVQKILENLAPAMWLTEVHTDHYKVPDEPENGKR